MSVLCVWKRSCRRSESNEWDRWQEGQSSVWYVAVNKIGKQKNWKQKERKIWKEKNTMHDKIWSDQYSVKTYERFDLSRVLLPEAGSESRKKSTVKVFSIWIIFLQLLIFHSWDSVSWDLGGWKFIFDCLRLNNKASVLTLNVIYLWHWFKCFAVGHDWTRVQWAVCLHHKHCWPAQAGGWNFFGILTMIVTPLPSSLKILQPQIARLIFRVSLWRCGTRTSWSKTTT